MREIEVVSLVFLNCVKCKIQRGILFAALKHGGFRIIETPLVYEQDPECFAEACLSFGVEDAPVFIVGNHVFEGNFRREDVLRVLKDL